MNQMDEDGFLWTCSVGFNMKLDDVDVMLKKYGVDMQRDSLITCEEVLHDHIGEQRWQKGLRIMQERAARASQEVAMGGSHA